MQRRRELDSLRGLAAIAVLFYHVLATNFSAFNTGIYLGKENGFLNNLLVYTPLHIFWIGDEAVILFFVLSGFVLTRMASRPGFTWRAYYPSRMVRLYLPVWGAVALGFLNFHLIVRHAAPKGLPSIAGPAGYGGQDVLRDLTLFNGSSTAVGTLWSLQWEVVFSLALPVYLILVKQFPKSATVLALFVCVRGWMLNDLATEWLPMFFIGAILAQYWKPISQRFAFIERPGARAHMLGVLLTLVSISGITSYFLLGRLVKALGLSPHPVTIVLTLAGVALLVIVVQQWTPLQRLLSTRFFVFFGTISFSLYLVHLPIVTAYVYVLHRGWLAALLAIATSFVVAFLFYFFIEKRAHHLSRWISRRLTAAPEPATTDAPLTAERNEPNGAA